MQYDAGPMSTTAPKQSEARERVLGLIEELGIGDASPAEPIVVVKRLRLADDETMAIETLHVRASLVPGLSADDLEHHSFYTLLTERYGIDIVGGLQTIEPTV